MSLIRVNASIQTIVYYILKCAVPLARGMHTHLSIIFVSKVRYSKFECDFKFTKYSRGAELMFSSIKLGTKFHLHHFG